MRGGDDGAAPYRAASSAYWMNVNAVAAGGASLSRTKYKIVTLMTHFMVMDTLPG